MKLLPEARNDNNFVEPYLTGRKRMTSALLGYYSPGDESEAKYVAVNLRPAWKGQPLAHVPKPARLPEPLCRHSTRTDLPDARSCCGQDPPSPRARHANTPQPRPQAIFDPYSVHTPDTLPVTWYLQARHVG